MSLALTKCIQDSGFVRAMDVGAGSGWLAKTLAVLCPSGEVAAVEINTNAVKFMSNVESTNLPSNVTPVPADAIAVLEDNGAEYDLIVSNPPYVPTLNETLCDHLSGKTVKSSSQPDSSNFFLGTNLPCYLLETQLPRMLERNPDARCVLLFSSVSLLSKHLVNVLQDLPRHGIGFDIIAQEEVHLRYWFFTRTDPRNFSNGEYLWKDCMVPIGGHEFFGGITEEPRTQARQRQDPAQVRDRTGGGTGWQVVYVLQFRKATNADKEATGCPKVGDTAEQGTDGEGGAQSEEPYADGALAHEPR